MAQYDFDFQRYVERRKGQREASAREGAAYAYGGDTRVLRTLDRLRPVRMALESTARLWKSNARAELLGTSIRVSETHFPKVLALAARCAEALHIDPPAVYLSPQIASLSLHTFGTDDDAAVVLHAGLMDELDEAELLYALGTECGHIQNGHVLFRTALYFLVHSASTFVRWIVTPAVAALEAWSRRSDVTADRAGLLCSRDVERSAGALVKLALSPDERKATAEVDELLAQVRRASAGPSAVGALLERHPALPRRVAALRTFSESAYYRGVMGEAGGYTQEACDERVAEILRENP